MQFRLKLAQKSRREIEAVGRGGPAQTFFHKALITITGRARQPRPECTCEGSKRHASAAVRVSRDQYAEQCRPAAPPDAPLERRFIARVFMIPVSSQKFTRVLGCAASVIGTKSRPKILRFTVIPATSPELAISTEESCPNRKRLRKQSRPVEALALTESERLRRSHVV